MVVVEPVAHAVVHCHAATLTQMEEEVRLVHAEIGERFYRVYFGEGEQEEKHEEEAQFFHGVFKYYINQSQISLRFPKGQIF